MLPADTTCVHVYLMCVEVDVSFVAAEYTVMEDAGSVVLVVERVGHFPVTVNVTTIDGTASGGICACI